MQNLVRGGLSEKQVKDLIQASHISAEWGADLLDLDNKYQGDISDLISDCTVEYNLEADVHRLVRLTLRDKLDWANVRVRVWQQYGTARFNQGVFGLQTPLTSTSKGSIDVQGYDLGSMLNESVDDTIVAPEGTLALSFMDELIQRANIPGLEVRLDPSAAELTLSTDLTWALNVANPETWAILLSDLTANISYDQVWVDPDGRLRAVPLIDPVDRASEWTFDLSDKKTDIVEPDRSMEEDQFDPTNWWGFIYSELGTEPVDGAGMHIVDISGGSRKVRKWVPLNVTDQESLVTQGDAQVARDIARNKRIRISTPPMPHYDHNDVVTFRDPILGSFKATVSSFQANYPQRRVTSTLEIIGDGPADE